MVCISSFGNKFSFAAVGLLLPWERPLLLTETSNPPNPLLVVEVVVVVVVNFVPAKPLLLIEPNKDAVNIFCH